MMTLDNNAAGEAATSERATRRRLSRSYRQVIANGWKGGFGYDEPVKVLPHSVCPARYSRVRSSYRLKLVITSCDARGCNCANMRRLKGFPTREF